MSKKIHDDIKRYLGKGVVGDAAAEHRRLQTTATSTSGRSPLKEFLWGRKGNQTQTGRRGNTFLRIGTSGARANFALTRAEKQRGKGRRRDVTGLQ